jgi:glycosyltransferase involved in cell wall biosynthesis
MHICFLCSEYPPGKHGGIGSFTQTLGRVLAKRGHQITVIGLYAVERNQREQDEGVCVIRLAQTRVPKMGFFFNGLKLRSALRQLHMERPINILDGSEGSFALLPNSYPSKRIIRMQGGHYFFSTTLGLKPRPWRSWLEKRSFARANALCAVSNFVAETTADLLRLVGDDIEILPNPVDTSFFSPQSRIAEREGLIIFVGTVVEKKGVRELIQAMPLIVNAVPNAHLWIVGRDWVNPDTGKPFRSVLEGIISPQVKGKVIFKGAIDHGDLPSTLAQAQVCVFPSHMESQGIVIVEGMAMGKAVVASQTGPGPEIIEDGVSGLLCDPYDPKSIAEKTIQVLKDAELRRKLGIAARQRAVDFFSVESLVLKNEQFYQKVLGQG